MREAHPGVVRMKSLARSYMWWSEMDKPQEPVTKKCVQCQQHHREEPNTPLRPLEFPTKPWQRIHLDFAGPFLETMWLISQQLLICTIEVLRLIFTHALDYLNRL